MDLRPLALGVIGITATTVGFAGPPQLNLFTFESPPYQMTALAGGGAVEVVGETIDTVSCAAGLAGWSTRVRVTPQNRAEHALRRNLIDGYFAIDPSTELDAMAKRSDPVNLEKWYFFTTASDVTPELDRIGVVDGSNEKAWLEANSYSIFMNVSAPSQLPALLNRGRIDAALMDKRAMTNLQDPDNAWAENLKAHFLRYAPLYLYMSENFTANNPDFLPTFNRFLPECMAGQITLSNEEEDRIRKLAGRLFGEIDSELDLLQAIDAGPRTETLTDILTTDIKWRALAPENATDIADTILKLPGSRTLHAWKRKHNELVTEAFLTNNMGTVTAMSQLTSDYWQGDERKFTQVLDNIRNGLSGTDAIYISDIRFDASTARFQVTVSAPVGPVADNIPQGIIALGLDVERALGDPNFD